jgi:hypothetical protein
LRLAFVAVERAAADGEHVGAALTYMLRRLTPQGASSVDRGCRLARAHRRKQQRAVLLRERVT